MEERRLKKEDIRKRIEFVVSFYLSFAVLFTISLQGQESDTLKVSLIFAGDIMGHDEQIKSALDTLTGAYNYEPTFRFIKPFIEQADIAVANLEVTLAGPAYKGYPQFSSPDGLAKAARDAGFDVFIQANNHALDRGTSGFLRTLAVLDSLGILHTGTFADSIERNLHYPLMLQKNNIRIALLNYTYGTNGIEIPRPFIINRIDTGMIRRDIQKARCDGADFVIVTTHWGNEYERFQNTQQKMLAAMMFSQGTGAIIGSHPHVIQPVELVYNADSALTGLVVYSLGNFVSNQRAQYKDGGISFQLELIKTASGTSINRFSYLPSWVYREDLADRSVFYVIPVSLYERNNDLIRLKEYDRYKIARFAEDTRMHLRNVKEKVMSNE